jgi:uncharacterized protein YfaS (alpha-2-macroglobulin family)
MKRVFAILLFPAAALLMTFCASRQTVRIDSTNFSDLIQEYQNLSFKFNQQLAPDSLFNRWDSTEYIHFEPPVKGKFRWISADELEFSPLEPFAPSTEYSARLTGNIVNHSKEKFNPDLGLEEFHTPYLELESVSTYWALSESNANQPEVRIRISFNYEVDPNLLGQLLSIELENESVSYLFLSKAPSDVIEVYLQEPSLAGLSEADVSLTIAAGLQCQGSNWDTPKSLKKSARIPSRDAMQVSGISSVWEQGKGMILIRTTQPVAGDGLKEMITIEPPVEFSVETIRDGIRLEGEFMEGQSYRIILSEEMKGIFGRKLGKTFSQYVTFSQIEPYLAFTDKHAVYLSARGARNLGIQIIHVPKVKLSVFKIFENNLMHYLRAGKDWEWYYDDDQYYDFYNYTFDDYYGQMVFSKVIETASFPKNGNIRLLNLDLKEMGFSDSFKGVYLIRVESTESSWLRDVQLVSLSDIGLIVKDGLDDVYVFANSLLDATPEAGVKIDFLSANNQLVYSTVTDHDGVAVLRNKKSVFPGSQVNMVLARKGDDFNYISFRESWVSTSRFEVGGKRTANTNYDVFIYGDRELYRPGDSAYLNAVVRTSEWKTVSDLPVKLKMTTPDGREFLSFKKILGIQGAAEARFYIPADAMTGTYVVDVFSGNDVLIGSSHFRVEEFVPDRIKVTATTSQASYRPADVVTLNINAMNLFGPPAAGRNYEVELQLNPKTFMPSKYPGYLFDVNLPANLSFSNVRREGKTDAAGNASERFNLNQYHDIGLVEGRIYSTVFDETGRPVNRLTRFDLFTQDIFFGIGNFDYWTDTRHPLRIGFIAVDTKGSVLRNQTALIDIFHISWETVIERNRDRYTYRSEKQETVVYSREVSLTDGTAQIEFTPSLSGMYEVRIQQNEGSNYVSREFYAYGWGDTDYTSFEVNKDGEVLIELDKESYAPGDKARLLFKAPFDGALLVTVERGGVLEYHYLHTNDKAVDLSVRVGENFVPNVYISATAIRKLGQDDLPLTVAHGYTPMIVENKANKLDLDIQAIGSSRSKSTQTIGVRTKPGAEVTVAVVDEGILQITGYETPDPYAYFYQKRALEVDPYDMYAWLYPEIRAGQSSSGGGEGFDMGKRINPMTSKRFKLVSLWSGIMKANARGECHFTADIPQFSGSLRVMAVAYKDHQFAGADHTIVVADPIVISSALPRFLSPGDKVMMPVNISNTTGKATLAQVTLHVGGPLIAEGDGTERIEVPANGEAQVFFALNAADAIGQGDVTVQVEAFDEKFTEQNQIPVRPPAGLQKITGSGSVRGDKSATFSIETDFIEGTTGSRLAVSKSPVTEFTKDLTNLLGYPYGCLEQTVSRAFPLIYFDDLAKVLGQEKSNMPFNPSFLVNEAIRKIYGLQQYDGGLLFWPGGDHVSWWGTAYAAHFLIEAREAGYQVDSRVLDRMLKYINMRSKEKETDDFYFRDKEGNSVKKLLPKREIFYSLYVLALNRSQNLSLMNHYKSSKEQLTDDSRYLLACAYMLTGDEGSYKMILPASMGSLKSERSFGGSLSSHTRDLAIVLSSMLDADPENLQVPVLSKALSEQLKANRWLSTQESAFSLIALGKLSSQAVRSDIQAKIFIAGQLAGEFTGNDLAVTEDLNNRQVEIRAAGSGMLYYSYEVEGISATGSYREEDSYLEVRKAFFTRAGVPVSAASYEQNDLIVIRLSVRSTLLDRVENVAITDLLPACFEIENPRVTPERDLSWIKDRYYPDYLDIRDDRLSIFTTAGREWKHFYYIVRVVSRGEYVMGPVGADAMYNGEYHSYSGGGKVVVR